ncbi:MAG TPA: hypothetical protein VM509_16390 [Planctomycetota bacterium]|nr:hypothetical protein [Planctomycetota bacterium]
MAGDTTGYRTHAIVAGLVVAGVVAGLVGWKTTWGPDARARRVSEILSGQPAHPDRGTADKVLDLLFKGTIGDGPVERQQWATLELGRLAKDHPASLARAAAGTTPDVRFAFLDVIEKSGPYAALPVAMRVEHAGVHVSRRLDREGAAGFTAAQEEALRADKREALRVLRNALVAGHCGSLAGYDLLGEVPKPQDFVAAAEALARSASQPLYAEMDELSINHCRDVIARRAAPTTDGGMQVVNPR